MAKKRVRLADIANLRRDVDVNEEESFSVRALTLQEMVSLFISNTEQFLKLYSAGLSDG